MRLLIADNSSLYNKMFRQAAAELDKNAAVTCVGNGNEAFDIIRREEYDILVIDIETPELDLDELLKITAAEIPNALVLVTAPHSSVSHRVCAQAMEQGASDCMIKPVQNSYGENYEVVRRKMSDIFKIAYERRERNVNGPEAEPEEETNSLPECEFTPKIVLIAVSTGGPSALENILTKLSRDFPAPILVVQHIAPQFTELLARHLDQKSQLSVKIAEDEEVVAAGTVYIAPGGTHMKLCEENKIRLDDSPPIGGIRPAADALFESVAESFAESGVLAVILTGMGNDGKNGLALLKEKQDCYCLAQSEKTRVVFGMPSAAAESGLVDKILDLERIPAAMEKLTAKRA